MPGYGMRKGINEENHRQPLFPEFPQLFPQTLILASLLQASNRFAKIGFTIPKMDRQLVVSP